MSLQSQQHSNSFSNFFLNHKQFDMFEFFFEFYNVKNKRISFRICIKIRYYNQLFC